MSLTLRLDVVGVAELEKRLHAAMKQIRRHVNAALYEEGLAIGARAVKKTPVDTGRLRSSAYVTPPTEVSADRTIVEVGFGTEYAVPVHERVKARHIPPGEAKFLEKAMFERAGGMTLRIVARAWNNFRAGRGGVAAIKGSLPERPSPGGAQYQPTRDTFRKVKRHNRKIKLRQKRRK